MEVIISILFLLAYWVLQSVANKRRQTGAPGETPPEALEEGSTSRTSPTLEDALREIGTYLNQGTTAEERPSTASPTALPPTREVGTRTAEPPRRPTPTTASPTIASQRAAQTPRSAPAPYRTETAPRTPEFRGLEDQFESGMRREFHAPDTSRATRATRTQRRSPVVKPASTPEPSQKKRLLKHLYSRDSLREAVLLSEILGPPRSRRR